MADVQEIVADVERSEEFAVFRRRRPDDVLVHLFCHVKDGTAPVEIGYYGGEQITVFRTAPVQMLPPDKVFGNGELRQLDLGAVRIGLAQAKRLAEERRNETHAHHPVMQAIYLLQQGDVPVWNVTLVTATLQMLNYKLDATSGDLLSSGYSSLLDFGQKV